MRILDGLPKNKELWSYVVKFEFSGPKVAHIGPTCVELSPQVAHIRVLKRA